MDNNSRKKKKTSAAPSDGAESVPEKRTPIKTIREGDCSVSIWHRVYAVKGKLTDFYSLTFERSYREKGGEWKYTKSFSIEDLPKLVTLIHLVEAAVSELRSEEAAQ